MQMPMSMLQSNVHGNIVRYTDTAGNVVAECTYDAFGKTIAQSGPMADIFRIRFSTKYFDSDTGLYYYGYRFYSPSLMRWLNRDLIGEEGGLNLYGFVNNSPIFCCDYVGMRIITTRNPHPKRVKDITYITKSAIKRPRAMTIKTGSIRFYCDRNCRLHIDGNIKLSIEMLESNNPRWNKHYAQYDTNPFVSPDLMAYSHELDHYNTWSCYLDIIEQLNAYDGKLYSNCKEIMSKLQAKHDLLLSLIKLHSNDFDSKDLNQGLRYRDTPFDSSCFSWELLP